MAGQLPGERARALATRRARDHGGYCIGDIEVSCVIVGFLGRACAVGVRAGARSSAVALVRVRCEVLRAECLIIGCHQA